MGFRRIRLEPGAKKSVIFPLEAASLAIYDINMRRRTEQGMFRIMIGSSSKELSSIQIQVKD
jgi:beta-glucosidase